MGRPHKVDDKTILGLLPATLGQLARQTGMTKTGMRGRLIGLGCMSQPGPTVNEGRGPQPNLWVNLWARPE